MGDLFLQGILTVGTPTYLLYILAGVTVGIIFGAVPGLTAVMAITLFLPVTYGMESCAGHIVACGIIYRGDIRRSDISNLT